MARKQSLCRTGRLIFGLLEHRELIRIHRLEFMNTRLQMPTGKISAIASRKRACTKASDRRALPVAVVDVAWAERGFCRPGICQWLPYRSSPRGLGNIVGER